MEAKKKKSKFFFSTIVSRVDCGVKLAVGAACTERGTRPRAFDRASFWPGGASYPPESGRRVPIRIG